MYNKTVAQGVIGQVVARGTWYLSLAKATLLSSVMKNARFTYPALQPSKLRYLDMGACSITIQDLEELTSTCHSLEKVSLEKICNISAKACENLVQSAKSLKILNLCDCFGIESEGIQNIVKNCSRLEELNLAFNGLSR